MRKAFPRIIFGKCPVCGSDGGDYAEADLTSADATTSIETSGNGVELIFYRGKKMCHKCKQDKINDNQSRIKTRKMNREEVFRSNAGFRHSIPD